MPRFRNLAVLAGLLSLLALPAMADDEYKRCIDASDGTNPAWAACGGAWVAREDAKLNAVWKRVYDGRSALTKADLLEEQRFWNAFKEKACRFYGNGEWGREGQVLEFPTCRASLIAQRTAALEAYGVYFNR